MQQSIKRASAKNVGLSYILLTVVLTSCAWVLLDFYLIYAAGFQKAGPRSASKMPLDKRADHHLTDNHKVNHQVNKPNNIKVNFEAIKAEKAKETQGHQAPLPAQHLRVPTRKFERAVQKMKQMREVSKHHSREFNIQAANKAAERHRKSMEDDLKFEVVHEPKKSRSDDYEEEEEEEEEPQPEKSLVWEQVR